MNISSGCSNPIYGLNSLLSRVGFLFVIAIVSGIYWNLGWPLALPFIGIAFPVGMPVLIEWLCYRMTGGRKYGVYVATVFLSEVMRCLLYVVFGHGLQYLLHDGETQVVYIAIITDQLLLGGMTLGVLTWRQRTRGKSCRSNNPADEK